MLFRTQWSVVHPGPEVRGQQVSFNPTSRALSSHSLLATSLSCPSGDASFSAQSLKTHTLTYHVHSGDVYDLKAHIYSESCHWAAELCVVIIGERSTQKKKYQYHTVEILCGQPSLSRSFSLQEPGGRIQVLSEMFGFVVWFVFLLVCLFSLSSLQLGHLLQEPLRYVGE